MEDLKSLVEQLARSTDKDEIVKHLQIIGGKLLTEYELRVNNIVIEPLRVEPYFYNPNKFEDKFMHRDEKTGTYGPNQRNKFGELYIHKGFLGVDIVLSLKEDYAFSFLIKNSRVISNNEISFPFLKQYGIAKILKDIGIPLDYDKKVLHKKSKSNNSIVFRTVRNGLTKIVEREDFSREEQKKYSDLLVSSFIELKEHSSSQYDFSAGYGGDRAVVEYLKEYKKMNPDVSIEVLNEMRKELYPNGSKSEFEKTFK